MPTSRRRRAVNIQADLYEQIQAIAQREGRPTQRQADIILAVGLNEYARQREGGKHPLTAAQAATDKRGILAESLELARKWRQPTTSAP